MNVAGTGTRVALARLVPRQLLGDASSLVREEALRTLSSQCRMNRIRASDALDDSGDSLEMALPALAPLILHAVGGSLLRTKTQTKKTQTQKAVKKMGTMGKMGGNGRRRRESGDRGDRSGGDG